MGLGPTLLILMAALATASLANWRERRPRTLGNPPLLPPTTIQMVALVVALIMAAHLVSLLSGQPLRSRFGI
jgi:hypothetical protein